MGSVSSGLTFVFYYKGMQASNAILASVMTLLGPVTGLALSVFLLHESFNAVQVIGIAGLLSTVYFLSTAEIEQAPRKATDPRRAWQDGAADPAGPTPSSEQPHRG
jgi:drug/metabolite transporter (DMT)-like permease